MLKITALCQTDPETILLLEGWVVGDDVNVLEEEVGPRLGQGERLVLDLRGVRSIDLAGLAFLQRCTAKGLTWRGAGPYVHMLLKEYGLA